MRKFIALVTCLILIPVFASSLFAEPVSPETAIKVGDIHLEGQKLFWLNKPGLAIQAIQDYSILEVRELRDNGKLLAYILDLSPEGCIVISSDTDIPPVIAYSFKGRFSMEDTPDNVLFHLIKLDMGNRIDALPVMSSLLKDESNELWESYLVQEDIIVQQISSEDVWGPWLTTTWHQDTPYKNYCPIDPETGNRCVVGCTATAMAQIINYWKFPGSMSFNWENDHYVSKEGMVKEIRIDEDHEVLDFPSFDELSQMLSDIQYDGNEDEIAALCFACGISVRMDYSSSGSGAFCSARIFSGFGFLATGKSGEDEDFYQALEQDMKEERAAWISIRGESAGHAIVADGFRDTWGGETGDFYHLNFGWGPYSPDPIDECWYNLPEGLPDGYSTISSCVLDIHPPSDLPIVYVSNSIGDDVVGDGTPENPYRTIQKGIHETRNGNTVVVMDGTYTGTGNVNLDFHGKAITVGSENGAEFCIIDCEGSENTRGFYFHSGETADSVLDGFTIQNGSSDYGGGIRCSGSHPTIRNNIITGNSVSLYGGGIYCAGSSPTIVNNAISSNSATLGGGVFCMSSSSPTLVNNTIISNTSGYGINCWYNCSLTLINTIIWNNSPNEIYLGYSGDPNTLSISYSCVEGGEDGIATNENNTVNWLAGNVDSDPTFADPGNGDFHLTDYSPCIGAGTSSGAPAEDIEGNSRGTPPDMGAYENSRDEPLNRLPVANDHSASTDEDTPVAVTLSGSDEDGDSLTYIVVTNPANGSLTGTAPDLTYTPNLNHNGSDSFTFKVNDGQDDSNTATVDITINALNDPPEIASTSVTEATEDTLYTYDVEATDPDAGDVLTYFLTTTPRDMTIDANTGLINWIPTNDQVGDNDVTVEVKDTENATDTQSFTINVENTNDPPEITSTAVTEATEDTLYTYDVEAADPDTGDVLTYSLTTTPTDMTIDANTGLVQWTPTNDQVGDNDVTVEVKDTEDATDTQSFTINVENTNDPPEITSTAVTEATEDTLYTYDVEAADPDTGDVLTYSLTTSPTDMTIDANTGLVQWTPTNDQVGDNDVTVEVKDTENATDTQSFIISVEKSNATPVADAAGPYLAEIGEEITFDGSGSYDVDSDLLVSYLWDFGDGDEGTGVNPKHIYTELGTYTVTLVVNDGEADSDPSMAIVYVVTDPDDVQQISLNLAIGWNLISFQTQPLDTDPYCVLASILDVCEAVWTHNADSLEWLRFVIKGSPSLNNLDKIEAGKAYWIKVNQPVTLIIRGVAHTATVVLLKQGWNLVAYNGQISQSIQECISSIRCDLVYTYDQGQWFWYMSNHLHSMNTLQFMDPGKGYWMHIEEECIWNGQ